MQVCLHFIRAYPFFLFAMPGMQDISRCICSFCFARPSYAHVGRLPGTLAFRTPDFCTLPFRARPRIRHSTVHSCDHIGHLPRIWVIHAPTNSTVWDTFTSRTWYVLSRFDTCVHGDRTIRFVDMEAVSVHRSFSPSYATTSFLLSLS